MGTEQPAFKVGSVVWALVLGGGLVLVGGSILLPSTKRANVDFRRAMEQAAATQAATQPAADADTAAPSARP